MKSIMLCYNLKGTKKGRKIGMLGSFLGFRVKYVEKEEYSKTIGVLTGLKEEVVEEASREETSGTDNEKNEEITDIRKIYKSGVSDSVIEKYLDFIEVIRADTR